MRHTGYYYEPHEYFKEITKSMTSLSESLKEKLKTEDRIRALEEKK